jgi:hypothetical protein
MEELRKSPYEQAQDLFRQHPEEGTFADALVDHLESGYVFSTPDVFMLGKPVNDGWFVHTLCGDMQKAIELMPYFLPWIAFVRYHNGKRRLAMYRTVRLKALCEPAKPALTFTD